MKTAENKTLEASIAVKQLLPFAKLDMTTPLKQ